MKLHTLFCILILLFLVTAPFSISAQITGSVYIFDPHPDYRFSAQVTGENSWSENSNQIVTLNLSLILIPNNISRIYIDFVSFSLIGQIGGVDQSIGLAQNVAEAILSQNNQTLVLNTTLATPNEVDRFYIKIGIFVRSDGNTSRVEYPLRFPDSTKILVERDNFVPLIDLYGFPPDAFFKQFLPVYLFIFAVFSLPGFVFLGVRVSQRLGNKKLEVSE